jgi:fluoride exporter
MSDEFRPGLYFWAGLGGAIGSLLRFGISLLWLAWAVGDWPWPTLIVNVLGSALIGLLAATTGEAGRWPLRNDHQVFLMVGFCGGLTTFSFVSLELGLMLQQGQWGLLVIWMSVSVICWLGAAWAGYIAGLKLNRSAGA